MDTSRLPDDRPESGDVVVDREENYRIIVEFHRDSVSVNLYVEPQSEYPDIVPDEVLGPVSGESSVDASGETSTVDELPAPYPQLFDGVVTAVGEKYGGRQSTGATCTGCLPSPHSRANMLRFTAFVE